jgi:NDP-sugar pyrophosphorylase family protein
VRSLVEYHRRNFALATIGLVEAADASRYGTVEVCEISKVQSFREKREIHEPGLINGGVYVFNREVLGMIPAGRAVSLEKETMPALLAAGQRVFGFQKASSLKPQASSHSPGSSFFIDIGTPEDLLRLQKNPEELLRIVNDEVRTTKYERSDFGLRTSHFRE